MIPRHRGERWRPGDAGDLAGELSKRTRERLLHGLTHRRQSPRALLSAPSVLSGRSDELVGLSEREALETLRVGRAIVSELFQAPPAGLVPPAWRSGPVGPGLLRRAELEYQVGLWRIETAGGARMRLSTCSWDWGVIEHASRLGTLPAIASGLIGALTRSPPRCLVVAIHPADVSRGLLPKISRLIEACLQEGYRPATFGEVLRTHSLG